MSKAYGDFIGLVKELYDIRGCERILWWDQQTYMPPGGSGDRSLQLAALSVIGHQKLTSDAMASLLKELMSEPVLSGLTAEEQANVREIEWEYHRAASVPEDLVKQLAKVRSEASKYWAEAREKHDYSIFLPWLEEIIALKRREAEAIGYEDVPFDALLDGFEAGMRAKQIESLFKDLRSELVPIVAKIIGSDIEPDTTFLTSGYPVEDQKLFARWVAERIGFDFDKGRLDETTHPFTSGTPHDTRLTTRYNPEDPRPALFATIHEAGHGMYQQGLADEHYGTPMAQPVSLGIHESQSRSWENLIGRSRYAWKFFYPEFKKHFPKQLEGHDMEDFYAAINDVRPSFIRVESDEVTYNLHILLRFEIESMLFSDKLDPAEAPEAWNERMEKYLQIEVPNDAKGILQDIHWSMGYLGYFPTYTLGNLYAAQMFDTARAEIPDLEEGFSEGKFEPFLEWTREKVHRLGRLYRAGELVENITGKPLDHSHFIDYLNTKFRGLYGF